MIQAIFDTLGFKQEELKVYLTLLEAGAMPAGDLAKLMRSPRPSIYGYLERLAAAGLVTETMSRNVKVFAPASPARIKALYRTKIRDLRTKEQSLDDIIGELENRSGADLLQPRLTNFEGKRALQSVMEEILTVRPGITTFAFWPVRTVMMAVTPEFLRYHSKSRIRKNIGLQAIWPRNGGVDISQHPHLAWGPDFKAELRYAPMGVEPVMGYWVYGNRTLFLSGEASGYIIESASMAQMMKAQHQALWRSCEPVPFDRKIANEYINDLGSETANQNSAA